MDDILKGSLIAVILIASPFLLYLASKIWEYGKLKARAKFKQEEKTNGKSSRSGKAGTS